MENKKTQAYIKFQYTRKTYYLGVTYKNKIIIDKDQIHLTNPSAGRRLPFNLHILILSFLNHNSKSTYLVCPLFVHFKDLPNTPIKLVLLIVQIMLGSGPLFCDMGIDPNRAR